MANEIEAAQLAAGASALVALAGFWFSHTQKKREDSRSERELFESFNKRFDILNDVLNDISVSKPLSELTEVERHAVQDYLNLCSEEYLWYRRKLIGAEIWESWLAGTKYYLGFKAIAELFEREKNIAIDSYYGFFEMLNRVKILKK